MNKKEKEIEIHNKVSSAFQQINVDGAYGGITPSGKINLNFFSERYPIPKSTFFEIKNDKLIKKVRDSSESKKGIIREYNFGIYMDLRAAKGLSLWLQECVKNMEKRGKETKNAPACKK